MQYCDVKTICFESVPSVRLNWRNNNTWLRLKTNGIVLNVSLSKTQFDVFEVEQPLQSGVRVCMCVWERDYEIAKDCTSGNGEKERVPRFVSAHRQSLVIRFFLLQKIILITTTVELLLCQQLTKSSNWINNFWTFQLSQQLSECSVQLD